MALTINSNISAQFAQGSVRLSNRSISTTIERLSTGTRINSSSDDSAGLAISNVMTAQINGSEIAIRNANDGISLAQTADLSLSTIVSIFQRVRELAVQAANSTYSAKQRESLNAETGQLMSQINQIASSVQFNGIPLLDGTFKNKKFQIGPNNDSNNHISISIDSAKIDALGIESANSVETTQTIWASQLTGITVGGVNLTSGDLVINGVSIGNSTAPSAKAIAAAINGKTSQTGVTATARPTTSTSFVPAVDPIESVIDLGSYGKLIYPSQVDGGRLYYYWDSNGNGGWQAAVGDADAVSHDTLDAIFNQDINGNINAGGDTTDIYRYAMINGYKLALPTVGEAPAVIGFRPGTAVSGDTLNPSYNDYLALWDANNGSVNSTIIQGAPANWPPNGHFWTATPSGSSHAYFVMEDGHVVDGSQYSDSATRFVALQVLNSTGVFNQIPDDAIRINGVNIGSINSTSTGVLRGQQIVYAINSKSNLTGVRAVSDATNCAVTLTANDGRNIEISTLTNASISSEMIGIALNGVTSGGRSTTTFQSAIDLNSTSSLGIVIAASSNGETASGLVTGSTSPIATTIITPPQNFQVTNLDLSNEISASTAISNLDGAIEAISKTRASLGSVQNRLTYCVQNLEASSLNMHASRSRILDADYAIETTLLAKSQIIRQAATAMLTQANQTMQSVLALLR
jgi:flagellin